MALFQRPPSTPEELAESAPLDLAPAEVAAMDEATWYQRAFRKDVPQLTLRAVVMGSALGFLLAFTNLYVGLKTGWHLGVAITACLLSYAIWSGVLRLGLAKTPMTLLENNCMQSTASSAGYSTGSTYTTAIAALLVLTATATNPGGQRLPWGVLAAWTFALAALGVLVAVPMKRNMINHERLPFPTGLAAAVTLQSLYGRGTEALAKARAMFYGALAAGVLPLLMDLKLVRNPEGRLVPLMPADSAIFDFLPARGHHPKTGAALLPSDWTVVLDHKLVLVAAGVIVGMRVSAAMLLGSLLLVYWLGPAGLAAGAVTEPSSAWKEIGLWVGAGVLVSSALLQFAFGWRTIARAFRALRGAGGEAHRDIEVPTRWVTIGVFLSGTAVVALAHAYFGIPWPLGIAAVAFTFLLSLVACRATGESDITPMTALGNITQLSFGAVIPQNPVANLMTASITGSAAASAADLLTDLKSGYALGAHPRRQFVAQFLGIFAGTIATTWGFYLLVPDATVLTGAEGRPPVFPAPTAQQVIAVAKLFDVGIENLHPMARAGMLWGALAAVLLVVLERLLPPRAARFVPSATGIGLGLILPFQYPLSFFLGALAAMLWSWRRKASADRYAVAMSSGMIAGESLVGVVVAAVNNLR